MAKLFIGANVGSPESKRYTEIPVVDVVSRKALSYHLGCEVEDLQTIEAKIGLIPVEKPTKDSKMAVFYKIDDFPRIVQELKKMPVAKNLEFLKPVDPTTDKFEIVYESGSKIRFEKD